MRERHRRRSIPAHAGEPGSPSDPRRRRGVYPRPRGGTCYPSGGFSSRSGLSPPTRGNRQSAPPCSGIRRSIPAHAGEPSRTPATASGREVYPRPRGGTRKSPPESSAGGRAEVYPRPRGGTEGVRIPTSPAGGLSPPTRGNHTDVVELADYLRSIPAHAGEPTRTGASTTSPRVYPRPRGGTDARALEGLAGKGLSPPTRGNRRYEAGSAWASRSIPAHAGEPPHVQVSCAGTEVYPRPRGGTDAPFFRLPSELGLSPPTRGNPTRTGRYTAFSRSIPAHAGEPGGGGGE